MLVKLWGVRGSTPIEGSYFSHYGGATICIEITTDAGEAILIDAGSGLTIRGNAEEEAHPNPVILLTHMHFDHVQGLPHYAPLYDAATETEIYGPSMEHSASFPQVVEKIFNGIFHPVKFADLPPMRLHEFKPGDSFKIGSVLVETAPVNHPGGGVAYKISADGWTFAYTGDHEIPLEGASGEARKINEDLVRFLKGADVVLADSHFSAHDHSFHMGWGHSDFQQWPKTLQDVGHIVFAHFNPNYTDSMITSLAREAARNYPNQKTGAARQGCLIGPQGIIEKENAPSSCHYCSFFQQISSYSDIHAVLSALLLETRKLCNAEAGIIYLVENDGLMFYSIQNETLFPQSIANKYSYLKARLPINRSSIPGYVASTKQILNIADAYKLPAGCEYSFNRSFDSENGYRTVSMLVVPMLNYMGEVKGVLQLVNAKKNGHIIPFTERMARNIASFCEMATIPMEKAKMMGDMVLRMLDTPRLRDPAETPGHVQRVGAIAAEIYEAWARQNMIDTEEMLATKGQLRLAAMLHDVGKVAIPDPILKKNGKLDEGEFSIMKTHASQGADIFASCDSEVDCMARAIALHHHARWDGNGYTGARDIPSPAREDIPLWARITAIADVYDAMVSARCYKAAIPAEKVLKELKKSAGKQFDPQLVDIFMQIQDVIQSIYSGYSEPDFGGINRNNS